MGIQSSKRQCGKQAAERDLTIVALLLSLLAALGFGLNAEAETASAQNTLTTTVQAPALPKAMQKRKVEAGWNFVLSGETFGNQKEQAQTTGLGLGADLRFKLLSNLEIKAAGTVALESGYAQSQFGDNTAKSGLSLKEAVVQFKPISRVTLQGGAIDQGHLQAPLVVAQQPFPGALEKVLLGTRAFNTELKAEQTVPVSSTLSTKAVEAETTPSFTAETITVKTDPVPYLRFMAFGTHYAYHNLPSTVALASELYGNSVIEQGPRTASFRYEFDGFIAGGGLRWLMTPLLSLETEGHIIQNTKAPDDYGRGQYGSLAVNIGLPGDIDLTPKAEYFFAESDVAPGFYNSSDFGHGNRQGWAANIDTTFKQAAFKIGARYVDADVINPSFSQTRQQYFMIRFETLYEKL